METSLRYAIQLITTSNIVAMKAKKTQVGVEDLRRVYGIFADVKRSIAYLNEQSDLYMYHQRPDKMEIE